MSHDYELKKKKNESKKNLDTEQNTSEDDTS